MARIQLNLRIDKELEQAIDGKRIELQKKLGYIPTRSAIARFALDEYLGRSGEAKRAAHSKGR
ncbi:MAG TPA: CopG family transcriptional regulator [Casimicrobiaceae bacterium]|nr:CopG family transcriptional regulator [Casimicrobiaceae bacterium]